MSRDTVYAVGFYPWKRKILRTFRPEKRFVFVSSPRRLPQGRPLDIATWGARFRDEDFPAGSRITRYEDGFIRSTGLGAKFAPALSWVEDRRGIYYDASKPSDLEFILGHQEFPEELRARARRLREKIIAGGLTKYNLSGPSWTKPSQPGKFILVTGQVESDASIRLGSPGVKTNLGLLQRVRQENPEAYIIFKPHPDVVAGVRRAGRGEASAANLCDAVVADAAMHDLISLADEVHVNTSLAGFEALMRGKRVVTYGQPFYAGWGLTADRDPPVRRARTLSLDELVAAALIIYPLYRSAETTQPCAVEDVIDEILRGSRGPSRGPLEFILGKLSETRFWHRFCSQ